MGDLPMTTFHETTGNTPIVRSPLISLPDRLIGPRLKDEDSEDKFVPIELPDDFSLSNPDDVFECCDTDRSKNLDPDEACHINDSE